MKVVIFCKTVLATKKSLWVRRHCVRSVTDTVYFSEHFFTIQISHWKLQKEWKRERNTLIFLIQNFYFITIDPEALEKFLNCLQHSPGWHPAGRVTINELIAYVKLVIITHCRRHEIKRHILQALSVYFVTRHWIQCCGNWIKRIMYQAFHKFSLTEAVYAITG